MTQKNQDWDALGQHIQDLIDRAVNSRDYQKLNQEIRQTVDKAMDLGGEAVRKVRTAAQNASAAGRTMYDKPKPVPEAKPELPVLYGKTGGKTVLGIAKVTGGGLLCFTSLASVLANAVLHLVLGGPALTVSGVVSVLAGLGLGAGFLAGGIGNLNHVARFRRYRKLLGEKTHCSLEKLARAVGKSTKFVRKEVRKMIDEGLFLEGHLNKEETLLITSNETYRYFEQSRLQLEQRQKQEEEARLAKARNPVDTSVQEVLNRGDAFIAQIVRCNDEIPGIEISEKISRMEMIIRRIFRRAEAHPEVVPDLKKLMDYYLPMTIKLLNAYAEMDDQPIQGETIEKSKREIEDTIDTLNQAFEKLLDDLFEDAAMDISSDISVLNTLLTQEGLRDDELTRIRKQNNP